MCTGEKKDKGRQSRLFLSFVLILVLSGCAAYKLSRGVYAVSEAQNVPKGSPFLKVHLKNGHLYAFSQWIIDEVSGVVVGQGELRDVNRALVKSGSDTVAFDRIALFETNQLQTSPAVAAMTIVTGGSVALSIYCASNPKACFGSCPTFYAWNGERMELQAEGFSASILPSLEASDIDALYNARPTNSRLEIRMTNEAMETHVVRYADVLAVARRTSGRVFASPKGEFFEAIDFHEPATLLGPEGNSVSLVRAFDALERFSLADSNNLAEREILELSFESIPKGRLGLILGFRESLMTTYLFYQALAYLGNSAGTWLARCEQRSPKLAGYLSASGRVLGGIEVLMQDNQGEWVKVGEFNETGPIAANIQVLPLAKNLPPPRVMRLRMSKGLWRLNYVSLATIREADSPITIQPLEVRKGDLIDDVAKSRLIDSTQTLVTFPGQEYVLVYQLPEDFGRYELFLKTRGYYLEWIRDEWLIEENPARAISMFTRPEDFLKAEAPRYKAVESLMEESFWRSRYVRHEQN